MAINFKLQGRTNQPLLRNISIKHPKEKEWKEISISLISQFQKFLLKNKRLKFQTRKLRMNSH